MTIGDRERLLARIHQIRRSVSIRERADSEAGNAAAVAAAGAPPPDSLEALEARVAHLENLLEGLQDSVHRESDRHARLIAELQAQVDPAAMGAAIADDARQRGL